MADFTQQTISIRYNTDLWGPYSFRFPPCSTATANDGVIPYGASVASCDVKAYVGNVKASSNLASFTEITSSIIDPDYTPQVASNIVYVKFQYPGSTYAGDKVTLIFEINLSGGGVHPFFFQYLKVEGQSS